MRDPLRVRWLVVRAICGGLALLLFLAGCERGTTPPSAPVTSTTDETAQSAIESGRLSVLGTILPAQRVKLGFRVGGPVEVVNVQVGMEVKARDLLAELDATDLKLDVREAQEALARCQSALERASTGPWEQEVAVAEAQYQRALAQHEGLLAGARPEEIVAARADWEAALARYEQVKAGADAQELSAAEASLEKAEIALKRAQAAHDLVAWRPDLGASPQAAALHEATVDYQAAKAQLERLKGLPTEADLQDARAQLARAEAQLKLAQAGPSPQEVMASASSVAIAQAQLELAKVDPRLEGVAVATGQVQQARTALERAELALSRAQLPAPFDGTVSAVYHSPGEWAGPGVPVVELLNTSRWRVETRNVGELNIGRVRLGQEAVVRLIAFGDSELRGRVVAISPVAVVQQGDTTYTVFVDLESTGLNLRPGMNVEVEILTD